MKIMNMAALLLLLLCGCAISRPYIRETTTDTNGVVTVRELKLTMIACWPATQTMERQCGSIGKTLSLGAIGTDQDTTSSNAVAALKVIDSILGKLHP